MSVRADVVVIGAGGLGLSVSLQLALAGRSVILVDKHQLGSETSPRAAGLACQVKHERLQTLLSRESNKMLATFSQWTGGVDLVVHQSGGLKVARTAESAAADRREAAAGAEIGIDAYEVSPNEASSLAPYFRFSDGHAGIMYTPSDLYLDPRELVDGYIEACRRNAVDARPGSGVTALRRQGGRISHVVTDREEIECDAVVDTAGAWAGVVADLVGFRLPIVPVRHQLCVTEPLPAITNHHAVVRVVEQNVYMRPDRGGLMVGGYEPEPLRIPASALAGEFRVQDLELEFAPLQRLIDGISAEVPVLQGCSIREVRGGIPTMTADGNYVIDILPGVPNMVVVGGCNVAGLTTSPAIGRMAAALVQGEAPEIDLTPASLGRFDTRRFEDLEADALWRYSTREQWD